MDISFDRIKQIMEELGYYAEEDLIWDTYLNISRMVAEGKVGQKIHAICLTGLPGSGKSEYAKIYPKLLSELLGESVEQISYTCDSATGKSELYEEIRIVEAVVPDPDRDKIIIPGKIVEAIEAVNSGKKVILVLDEYDKAREETDSFLLQFLQDGKINTTQKGTLEIAEDKIQNIQVILCKNKAREHLSEPLERRLKFIDLKPMKPEIFYKVAHRKLAGKNEDIINLVCTVYGILYEKQNMLSRMPACSEGLLAIQDACDLLQVRAPDEFIHKAILANLLKNNNDIESFREFAKQDEKIGELFTKTFDLGKISGEEEYLALRRAILENFFSSDLTRVYQEIEEANRRVTEMEQEKQYLEQQLDATQQELDAQTDQTPDILAKNKAIAALKRYISELKEQLAKNSGMNALFGIQETPLSIHEPSLEDGKAIAAPRFVQLEEDKYSEPKQLEESIMCVSDTETGNSVRMAESIFDLKFPEQLQEFGFSYIYDTDYENTNDLSLLHLKAGLNIIKSFPGAKLFDDGILLYDDNGIKIGAVLCRDEVTDKVKYKFFTNRLVLPIYALRPVAKLIEELSRREEKATEGGTQIDCIVSSDEKKGEKTDDGQGVFKLCSHLNGDIYRIRYSDRCNSHSNIASDLSRWISIRYDNEEKRRNLLVAANTRERQMRHTGEYVPKSDEVISTLIIDGRFRTYR